MSTARLLLGALSVLLVLAVLSSANAFIHRRAPAPISNPENIATQWFTQRLDHFNAQDQRVWKQRYFVNEANYKAGSNAPIFFQIGGEGAISTGYVTSFMMSTYAQKYGALQIALEHRYYGISAPLPDLSTENLQYLSSQQALADAALFVESIKNKYNPNSPVIIFGGSYPGNLAAWFRMKYPHLAIGAIASSAPVQATLDFFEYLDVVDLSLSYFSGPQCDATIAAATKVIEQMIITIPGRKQLQTDFKLCGPITDWDDASTLMQSLMGNFMGTVQYNNEGPTPININFMCDSLQKSQSDPYTAYANLANLMLKNSGQSCLNVSYKAMIQQLRNTNQLFSGGMREWIYQSCAEFGYFQTTDSSAEVQPFGNLSPLNYSLQMCSDTYDMDFNTELLVEQTNVIYGGRNLLDGATNILFINGNIDPWHSLSVTSDVAPGIKTILINGTAHCADMSPPTSRDPPGLAVAQQQTSAYIGDLLSQYYSL
eukprot:TRINITY_DN1431_c0_g1_i1.p1 TRINITY_DN1431_c0_g1~~TRINITY_DN1431_c0_g1_i1.p1  ORF type:complete len:485 (-),score=196.03 TRINITY_DN1431_c0_g1_i1:96-1550(-)